MESPIKLTLTGVEPCLQMPSREFDIYVCLDVEIVEFENRPPNLYWRLIDPCFDLVEIGVNPLTGALTSVKLVFYMGELSMEENAIPSTVHTKAMGIPQFNLNMWPQPQVHYEQSIYDVVGRCSLSMARQDLMMRLFPDPIASIMHISDDLSCHFNAQDELIGFTIRRLKPHERTTLQKRLTYKD
jgi:hypothetical protein